ncbi:hypothetical protein [Corallococcus terminator]|uniref:Uncharacterized protein n=1 Tax=Corallococcus terminator TaxID=2316733 RepID=A0A3A8IM22_9BACT|nr:hypothetical protein [Corallococcus terminator]RKG84519.1 hypothetical protein D7V88_21830 [Corallococcus terminator]
MALFVTTTDPQGLIDGIKSAVASKKVAGWAYDAEGDVTSSEASLANQAWFRPTLVPGAGVVFTISAQKDKAITTEAYAAYHGRFLETLLGHFASQFTMASVTASGESRAGDIVKGG